VYRIKLAQDRVQWRVAIFALLIYDLFEGTINSSDCRISPSIGVFFFYKRSFDHKLAVKYFLMHSTNRFVTGIGYHISLTHRSK
jgi:hypothetical protein